MLLQRPELRILLGLLTSHCPLKYHLHTMHLAAFDACRLCKEHVETAGHIRCDCEAIALKWWQYFGRAIMKLLTYIAPRMVVKFSLSTRLKHDCIRV